MPEDGEVCLEYTASGGGSVKIPRVIDVAETLGIRRSATFAEAKSAYGRLCRSTSRQTRALSSIAYTMFTLGAELEASGAYQRVDANRVRIRSTDNAQLLAAAGATRALEAKLLGGSSSTKTALVNFKDERGRTALYIAARAGFYDLALLLLKSGADPNITQVDGSTALHAAAFSDQSLIVGLLIEYGASQSKRNRFGNTPMDEASEETKALVAQSHGETIGTCASTLVEANLAIGMRKITHDDQVIAYEVKGHFSARSAEHKDFDEWQTSWHGTKLRAVASIMKHGLLPAGTRIPGTSSDLQPPDNHYKLGETHFGIKDWARAIFVSPSLLYAAHACYSERVSSKGIRWCVVMKAKVKPGTFTSHDPTTAAKHDPIAGEPDQSEWRIPVSQGADTIQRVASAASIIVVGLVFVKVEFLDDVPTSNIKFPTLCELFE